MFLIVDYIIIVGWNDNVFMFFDQLCYEYKDQKKFLEIIIFVLINRFESLLFEYIFVYGDFIKENEYDKVCVKFV